ncbi:MAG: hypothetical protein PHI88_03585 [Candidatus Pacebacteria bacterium]|nr:hypothetical protein [Candidatus Paceibacterota bacterium]
MYLGEHLDIFVGHACLEKGEDMCCCAGCGKPAKSQDREVGFCSRCGRPLDEDAGLVDELLGYDPDIYEQQAQGTEGTSLSLHLLQELREGIFQVSEDEEGTIRFEDENDVFKSDDEGKMLPPRVSAREAHILSPFVMGLMARASGPLANYF